jgi:sugar (pentulose or hexulose) kinase
VKPAAVAVLDVGKTNKKVSLYDRRFNVLGEERTTLESSDFNGIEVENTEALLAWFRTALAKLAKDADVRAIAITTHGATIAVLDQQGKLAHPVISYTAAAGAEIQDEFYAAYGDRIALHKETSTPDLGFANMGKSLFLLERRRPDVWTKCRQALFYPAYLGYELTGNTGMEHTYLGNHSYLWNYTKKDWSRVGVDLNAPQLFPKTFSKPWENLGLLKPEIAAECGVRPDCKVTMGIHDSNANYLPYLAQGYSDFLLNSTGTWCVLMREASSVELTPGEMEAKVLFNLDALGRPVRTLIFPAGMEYDTFRAFTDLKDESNAETVARVLSEKRIFIVPGVLPDASAFPGATARVEIDGATTTVATLKKQQRSPYTHLGQDYFAALNISLALATRKMLDWCHIGKGTTVIIEGGFAKNKTYCQLLATLCPEQTFTLTDLKEGTSFGAALTGWMLAENCQLEAISREFKINTTKIQPHSYESLINYEQAYLRKTQS